MDIFEFSLKPNNSDRVPFLSGTKKGAYTFLNEGAGGSATTVIYILTFIFFGLMVTAIRTLDGFGVGLFYLVLLTFTTAVMVNEHQSSDTTNVAIIDMGSIKSWIVYIPAGIGIGLIFATFLRFYTGQFLSFEQLSILGVNVEVIIMILAPVVAIPIAEEAFFGGFLTPTLVEKVGLIFSSVLVAMVWVLWHLGTYNSSFSILVALFAFRILATFVIIGTRSIMPAIVAHIVINFFGTFIL